MTASLRAGIVGYGYATQTFHAPLIAATPGLSLAAVATSKPAALAAAWPEVQAVTRGEAARAAQGEILDALLAEAALDLVVIATANDSHYALARRALEAGKHVVVDKPFTLTAEEARQLERLAAARGVVLSVFHNRRWDADFLTLRRVLVGGAAGARGEAGPLGRVVHLESCFDRFRPQVRDRWRERAGPGAGLWYDLGPHLLDQVVQLFGVPRALYLDTARLRDDAQIDDWFHAVLDYGGLRAVLHAGMVAAQPAPRFVVHGLRGSAEKRGLDPQEDALRGGQRPGAAASWGVDAAPFELTLVDGERREARQLAAERGDYPAYYAGVRDAIRGEAANPVPAAEAVQVMELLELGLASAAARRELPLRTC